MRACLILAAAHLVAAPLAAQASARVDTIAEARRLRDANDFAGAAALMRPYVDSHPDDAGIARFAALMAYWAKQPSSDSLYATALAGHPQDADAPPRVRSIPRRDRTRRSRASRPRATRRHRLGPDYGRAGRCARVRCSARWTTGEAISRSARRVSRRARSRPERDRRASSAHRDRGCGVGLGAVRVRRMG